MAEYHYRKAAEIHPNNAVLLGCVGMVCKQKMQGARSRLVQLRAVLNGRFVGCREARGSRRSPRAVQRGRETVAGERVGALSASENAYLYEAI